MRIFFVIILVIFTTGPAFAQDDKNSGQKSESENLKELTNTIFKYQNFMPGKIISRDGSAISAKLNYNRILSQFLYISRQGTTLPLDSSLAAEKITIADDTFRIIGNITLEKITHYKGVNLYRKQSIKYITKAKSSNLNGPLIIADGSKLAYSKEDDNKEEVMDQGSQFKFINEYFLADDSTIVYPTTKRNFYDLFPLFKTQLKDYLQDHSVNFNNLEQLRQLVKYLSGL